MHIVHIVDCTITVKNEICYFTYTIHLHQVYKLPDFCLLFRLFYCTFVVCKL